VPSDVERLYTTDVYAGGFGLDVATGWWHFNPPMDTYFFDWDAFDYTNGVHYWSGDPAGSPGHLASVNTMAVAADNSLKLYAYSDQDLTGRVWVSADGGLTWARRAQVTGIADDHSNPMSLFSPADGTVFMLQYASTVAEGGIYRSLDDAHTWTKVVSAHSPTGAYPYTPPYAIGLMNISPTKLWWAEETAFYTTPDPSYPTSTIYWFTWVIRRSNYDGSSVETLGTFDTPCNNNTLMVWPVNDSLALVTSQSTGDALKVSSGGMVSICPRDIKSSDYDPSNGGYNGPGPWGALAIDSSTFVMIGSGIDYGDSGLRHGNLYVYRSTDAGVTWTLTTTIPPEQNFLNNGGGIGAPDIYIAMSQSRTRPDHLAMFGRGDSLPGHAQIIWFSFDGGVSWTNSLNLANPGVLNPNWTEGHTVSGGPDNRTYASEYPHGIYGFAEPPVIKAVPSRLATIVG